MIIMTHLHRLAAAGAACALAGMVLTGCGSTEEPSAPTPTEEATMATDASPAADASADEGSATDAGSAADAAQPIGMPAPQILTPAELSGQTIDLEVAESLAIAEADGIKATVDDETVAEFSGAYTEGSASFNGGITGLAQGETAVHLSDGTEFTVRVR